MVEWFTRTSRRLWRDSIAKLAVTLIHPVLHAKHPPEYTARGVGVGLFVAFTPFIGAHIAIVFMLWMIVRNVRPDMSFNPVLASAWTLLSNVFTIAPLFYVFIQTGRLMLGHWDNIQSFESYLPGFHQASITETGWLEAMSLRASYVFSEFGIPLLAGCLPWACLVAVVGYVVSLRFVRRHRAAAIG